jgi:hypothetical protein
VPIIEEPPVRIRVSNPRVAGDLLDALAAADCSGCQTEPDTVEVDIPWADDDPVQAHMELVFFVKAWEARHPGLNATVDC